MCPCKDYGEAFEEGDIIGLLLTNGSGSGAGKVQTRKQCAESAALAACAGSANLQIYWHCELYHGTCAQPSPTASAPGRDMSETKAACLIARSRRSPFARTGETWEWPTSAPLEYVLFARARCSAPLLYSVTCCHLADRLPPDMQRIGLKPHICGKAACSATQFSFLSASSCGWMAGG